MIAAKVIGCRNRNCAPGSAVGFVVRGDPRGCAVAGVARRTTRLRAGRRGSRAQDDAVAHPPLTRATSSCKKHVVLVDPVSQLTSDGEPCERAVLRERALWQAAVDCLPGVFYLISRDGRFVRWNQNLEGVTGYSAAEVAALRPAAFFRDADQEAAAAAIETTFTTGSSTLECDVLTKDGTALPYIFSGRLVEIDGEVCLAGMGLDLSERKRATATLREREGLLEKAVEQSPIAIAIVGLDGTIEYFNQQAIDLFGYLPADIPTMEHWWVLAYPDETYRAETLARWMELVGKAITLGTEIERGDYRVTCRGGVMKTVVIFGAVVGGKAFVMFEDITERERAADEALRERENSLAAIAENASDGIVITTPNGSHHYVNRKAAELTGYSVGELLETTVSKLLHPDDLPIIAQRQAARDAGQPTPERIELRLRTKAGATVPVEVSSTPTTWHGAAANLVVVRDVTERRRAEEERARLQNQLAQAQKLEAIGTLAGGVAHDFNNILAGLLGGLSLLDLELDEAGTPRPELQEMMALVTRGAELARQLLGFARRGKYDVRPLELTPVIQKTATLFGRTRKDLTLHLDLAHDLHSVLMDHAQLEQVLLNLFLNAGQAMPEGGTLAVCARNVELSSADTKEHGAAPGRFLKVIVADTGIGMSEATQARIFEPFFTTKAPGQGTGLGLASAYGIIKSHGGFITVDSALGEGTSFTLWLPATERPSHDEKGDAPTVQRGSATILIVDDEAHVAAVCARMLRRVGYTVLTASGGREAIELLREHGAGISLVILDMIMPDLGGAQTYDGLRALQPDIRVLLSSGHSAEGAAQALLARGCRGFLQKPFDTQALSAKVRELLA